MKFRLSSAVIAGCLFAGFSLTSCTVDKSAGLFSKPEASKTGSSTKKKISSSTAAKKQGETPVWVTKWKEAAAERAKEAEARKAKELAQKKKDDAVKARKKAEEEALKKKQEIAAAKEKAEKDRLREIDREKKKLEEQKRREEYVARKKAYIERREKEVAARKAAEEADRARRLAEASAAGEPQTAGFGGLFGSRPAVEARPAANPYYSEGHYVYVNQALLPSLNSSNSRIVVDISDQRARIYKSGSLVIETQISTGKPGHATPTGTWTIKEKLVEKKSGLYGRWLDSAGNTVPSKGDSRIRPRGGVTFVGADMPYWMRITGGIGMHIGFVPNHPASHGCIRVPSAVQPLIFSKVKVGTRVTIQY